MTSTATLQKWGNSSGIRLPKIILDNLSLKNEDKVIISVVNDTIVIKKSGAKRRSAISLEERFKTYTGNYNCYECDTGSPVGKEIM